MRNERESKREKKEGTGKGKSIIMFCRFKTETFLQNKYTILNYWKTIIPLNLFLYVCDK